MKYFLLSVLVIFVSTACGNTADTPQITRGKIALSFDDGPRGDGPYFEGADRTQAFIAALRDAEAPPAVFFVTTKGFDRDDGRGRIAQYAEAGHLIANHSHSHAWASRVGLDYVVADIDRAETELVGFANRRSWFRFPYLDEGKSLDLRDGIRDALKSRDLFNGYVTIDTFDWYIEQRWQKAVRDGRSVDLEALQEAYIEMLLGAVDFYDQVAVETFGETAPHVILLHENDLAALFIGDLIAALRSEGWKIISPDEAYAHPVAKIEPKTLNTGSGHFAALAIEKGRALDTLSHMAISETELDVFLAEKKVFGE
jgi:peptidoglycan/xylan/chitin deacetylase (PgdA/CDA1 family)